MTDYVCNCCGKHYKTLKGFEKHHCKQMDRKNEVNDITLYVFSIINNYYKICNFPEEHEKRIYCLINSKFFNLIKIMEKWAIEVKPINFVEYIIFLKRNNVPYNKWTAPWTYHCFLNVYLKEEPIAMAINRGEKYLADNELSLEKISANRLYLGIKYGHLSKKFLDYKKYNPRNILDDGQWNDVKIFFGSIMIIV